MTVEEKKEKLLSLIDELCKTTFAKDAQSIQNWIQELNVIYANEYRHTYSDIFFKVQSIISVSDTEVLEILGENLNVLYLEISKQYEENPADANLKNTIFSYKKFADHINLEIGRFNFIRSQLPKISENTSVGSEVGTTIPVAVDEKTNERLDVLEKAVDRIRPIATKAQSELDKLDSKLESNKISSITTLTIFSAVVLAFSGGITFEAGMLQGMSVASPYRLVFTIALTGFILFNTIFALLYMIGKMAGKTLIGKCKYWTENTHGESRHITCDGGCCSKKLKTSGIICKMLYKHTFVCIVNIILVSILYIDFFLWLCKDNLICITFIVSMFAPVVILLICMVAYGISKKEKKNRVLLKNKITLIKKLLELDAETEPTWTSIVTRTLSRAMGVKTDVERLTVKLKSLGYKEAIKAIDLFIENQFENEEQVYNIKILRKEHKKNKKRWKTLKKELKVYIGEQKQ